ncbi:unnamed protein product [Caenorhabditis angaria]|uniref:Uncharacterized protein n=1 Tax=Caenorhabditis angaria TaxID=860376 RepID=A0A9P1IKL1_9PELO|nr:unnamed protein product [Caenorhabditis angaria]
MDMINIRTKNLWQFARKMFIQIFCSGLSFSQLFSIYIDYFRRYFVPKSFEYPIDCFFAFFLFHLYLAYILIISISRNIFKHFKLKGSKIVPELRVAQQKIGLILTSFFVFQSIAKWSIGISMFDRIFGWIMQIKPQINFKPQIKFDKKSSIKTKMDTNIGLSLEPENSETQKTLKNLTETSRNLEFFGDVLENFEDENEEEKSINLVEKWLENEDSQNDQIVKKHLMKLVAQDIIRRRSFCSKQELEGIEDENV